MKGSWVVIIIGILLIGTLAVIQEVWAPLQFSPLHLSPIATQLEKIGDKLDRINEGFVSPPDDAPSIQRELDKIRSEATRIISTADLIEAKLPVGP